MTADVSSPSASQTGGDQATEVWRRAAEVVNVTSFTAAYRWNGEGATTPIRVEDHPGGFTPGSWFERSIAPIMVHFLKEVGAQEAVTILDWHDQGITLDPANITQWKLLVRDAWDRYRLPLLLVSGCGHADAIAEVTSLVQPYGDLGHWFRYRRRAWRAPRWNRRTNAIVFRGSTTGNAPSEGLDERLALALPRTQALLALHESGLPADVAFSQVVQAASGKQAAIEILLRERRIVAPAMSMRAMMNYRYQLMIDGNHGAWSGHVWKLLSGSTNLWVESRARNWFDGSFEPWIHYIPVRSDGLDLVDRYSAIRDDEPAARRIARACRGRARKVFTRRYMLRVQRQQWLAAWRSTIEGAV